MQREEKSIKDLLRGVDIKIDHRRLAEANPAVSRVILTPQGSPTLRDIFVPWFTRDGVPVTHLPPKDASRFPTVHSRLPQLGDTPLTIGEVADAADVPHPWYKPDSIHDCPVLTGSFPAYSVGNDRLLLLDGNHRCISLVRANAHYSVTLHVIHGPICPEVMADLAAFERQL